MQAEVYQNMLWNFNGAYYLSSRYTTTTVSYTHLYVVTDPKGTVLVECGKMLQRGTPKLDKDGKPVRNEKGKIIYESYKIRVFNTINFQKSMHFNPFAYIHSEKDILKIVTTLIANTKGEGKAGDDFWVSATRSQTVKSLRTSNRCV